MLREQLERQYVLGLEDGYTDGHMDGLQDGLMVLLQGLRPVFVKHDEDGFNRIVIVFR
jgi:hypothetical protein